MLKSLIQIAQKYTEKRVIITGAGSGLGFELCNIFLSDNWKVLPQMSPYNVTKSAVISLSETLSHELSKTNIKVKCFTPTFFQSSILQHSRGDKNTISKAQKIVTSSKLTSNDAAIIIIKSLSNNDETIRFPFVAKGLFYTKKYVPNLYKYLVRKFLVN